MNICLVVDARVDAPGGMMQSLFNERAALTAAGHHVSVVCLGPRVSDDPSTYCVQPSLSVIRGGDLSFAVLLGNPWTTSRLRRFFHDHRFDVVHVHSEVLLADTCVRLARASGRYVVITVHNYFWSARGPARWFGPIVIEPITLLYTGRRARLSRHRHAADHRGSAARRSPVRRRS